ncbi:MAG: CRISPR-associated endonuclease Cas1 [Candidatus Bathycorpusculaceae bacterium]
MPKPAKILRLELPVGSYLGKSEGCFEVRYKDGKIERYPHFEKGIGECILKSGSYVSVDALIDLALWNIDTYIMTKRNRVVAVLKSLEDDSHVKTRVAQYKALENGKGLEVAKQIVKSKLEGQNMVLEKYNLEKHDLKVLEKVAKIANRSLSQARKTLLQIEGSQTRRYFNQIFSLFSEKVRPEKRVTFKAYDGLNNVFNFAYYVLKCRVYKALLKAKLEPYLGFLHSLQFGKPSLVCDFMELYRYLIDDFLIERRNKFHKNDFVTVTDFILHLRMGKRIHLCEFEAGELAEALNKLFDGIVHVPRIRHGSRQTLDTLICEEALLLAKYLRGERAGWLPRLTSLLS